MENNFQAFCSTPNSLPWGSAPSSGTGLCDRLPPFCERFKRIIIQAGLLAAALLPLRLSLLRVSGIQLSKSCVCEGASPSPPFTVSSFLLYVDVPRGDRLPCSFFPLFTHSLEQWTCQVHIDFVCC